MYYLVSDFKNNDELLKFLITPLLPNKRGCALLGCAQFDKLGAVQNFLASQGFAKHDGKSNNCFAVHDCKGKKQRAESIAKIVAKYRHLPYVVFDNCESILDNDDVIKLFAHLIDAEEYSGFWDIADSKGNYEQFSTQSFYIFLSDYSSFLEKKDYPEGSAKMDRIQSFQFFVQVCDFS